MTSQASQALQVSPAELRRSVTELVDEWRAADRFRPTCDSWLRGFDLEFTRALAARGLLGIVQPREHGGRGLPGAYRLVVTEELLRHGAPVAAHWIADRQIGPSILLHGSALARERYLPAIAAGKVTFSLGMSEPDAGSDLAAVRTRAVRTPSGWSITGQKIWTSHGHRSTHLYVLARTDSGGAKHEGLTEFLVDLRDPGVSVRPIHDLGGQHHFNEVFLDDVPVADDHVLGTVGRGWQQVTSQLALERGGIERVLSTYPLFEATVAALAARVDRPAGDVRLVGEIAARYATLRAMAYDVARANDAGRAPVYEAALLKELGTALEAEVIEVARAVTEVPPDPDDTGLAGLLAQGVVAAPGFTVRGGTSEVLRTIVARGAASTAGTADPTADRADYLVDDLAHDLGRVVDEVLADAGGDPDPAVLGGVWGLVDDLGWTGIGVPEESGGEGGSLAELVTVVAGLGRHSVSLPLAEHVLARRAVARAGADGVGRPGAWTLALVPAEVAQRPVLRSGRLVGKVARVPWGRVADMLVVAARDAEDRPVLALLEGRADGVGLRPGRNLADEARDELILTGAPAVLLGPDDGELLAEAALLRGAAVQGALETALARTIEHTRTREQFGQPLVKFQAVGALVAALASEVAATRVAVARARDALAAGTDDGTDDGSLRVAAARVVAGRAATRAARDAHQAHGAMGTTHEHPLHLSTRRLWSWRDEHGSQRQWARLLGSHFLDAGPDELWRWITEQHREQATTEEHE